MKAKISRGSGFRGALFYLLDSGPKATGDKKPEVVGGNMAGRTIYELSREFGNVRGLRPDVKRPVWHCSLALPSGEVLPAEQWEKIAADFVSEMGFSRKTPFVVIRHSDTNYDHVHVLLSRIDLDSQLWHGQWEARTAINVTQKLEKKFALQLTAGLGAGRADRKQLTANEINKSAREGTPAPRAVIQNAIDALLDDGNMSSALEFAEGLELAGIAVRANVASTGRMNGFSFAYDGVAFKSSQLGKKYSWKKLQERGVSYEQIRDGDGLARFRAQPANPPTAGTAEADGAEQSGGRRATAGDSPAGERGAGTAGGVEFGGDRAARADSADDARYDVSRDDHPSDDEIREIDAAISEDDQRDSPTAPAEHSELGGRSHGGNDAAGAGEGGTPEVVENARAGRGQRSSGRSSGRGADWSSRFRAASSARRGRSSDARIAGSGNPGGVRVDQGDLRAARTVDPSRYLEGVGFSVRWEGRHASVRDERGDEHYRLTRKQDGRTVWCDLYGQDGGDSIALVRELEPDLPFVEAVYRLHGGNPAGPVSLPDRVPRQRYPTPKWGDADAAAAGRSYLREQRLIDDASIGYAEQSQMLRYDPQGAVLFVGYDDQERPRNVTRRATNSRETVQKRDLAGSDKAFPPILPGDRGAPVWIVEGGVDAIALHAEARATGNKIPQIIVSGGSGVRSFLENREVQQLLRDAPRVTIAADNESDADIQARTDAQHEAQRAAVAAFNPEVRVWHPPAELADLGAMRVARELRREDEAAERAADALVSDALARRLARRAAREQEKTAKNSLENEGLVKSQDPGPAGPGL